MSDSEPDIFIGTDDGEPTGEQLDIEGVSGGDASVDGEDIEPASVRTGSLSISGGQVQTTLDGLVVPVASGLGVKDAIDPSETTTPVSDARDLINASTDGHGSILLPPTTITEASSVRLTNNDLSIIGWRYKSEIEFTDLAADGFIIERAFNLYFDGFTVSGSDVSNRTDGYAFHWVSPDGTQDTNGAVHQNNIGWIGVDAWTNVAFYMDTGHAFSSHWDSIRCGTGNHGGCIRANDSFGPGLTINNIRWSPGGSSLPTIVRIKADDGASTTDVAGVINTINIGGDPGPALISRVSGSLETGEITWFGQSDVEAAVIIEAGRNTIHGLRANSTSTTTAAVRLKDNFWHKFDLGRVQVSGSGSFTNGEIEVVNDNSGDSAGSLYRGPESHITNNTGGALNAPISCLEGLTNYSG